MKSTTFSLILMALFCLFKVQALAGQTVDPEDNLHEEIARMDQKLFDAFNTGQMETIKDLFTKDLEFYHDRSGLSGYQSNIEAIGRLTTGEIKIRRELVSGSLEVYPIPGYGAIEEGQHDFFETLPGKAERKTGTFKFIHIWKKTDDGWKISRIVSYDH